MGLFQKALETYNCFSAKAGVAEEGHAALLPVSHIMQNAQIEISIDISGNFKGATLVDKKEQKTIIPATIESASRTGDNNRAHPLSDQLRYLIKINEDKYNAYISQLQAWTESAYCHPKAAAVLKYVQNGTILKDLAADKIIVLNDQGEPAEPKGCDKFMVRWRVLGDQQNNITACWMDTSLFEAYINYYDNQIKDNAMDLCMLDGDMDVVLESNPKGIVAANYGAKLISANDTSGFTFRGRFTEGRQAATVGYHASQKAHNALQWVASDQGVIIGGRTFICWNPKGNTVPKRMSLIKPNNQPAGDNQVDYLKNLQRTMLGCRNDLPANDDVIIASLDAATTGRLSVVYYNELKASDFLDRVENWYQTCCWYAWDWKNKKIYVQSPLITDIARFAFGVERKGKENADIDINDKLLREQVQRLYRCIADSAKIPFDIVKALAKRASMPLAYEFVNRNKLLFITCAVIRKYHNDILGKEEWKMSLEDNKKDRSYQFGRLLAVMEKIERDTYDKDEMREPNAIRMQTIFCERPLYVSKILNLRVTPYLQRQNIQIRAFYRNLIGKIMEELSCYSEFELNKPLKETYLMGYYLQRKELYTPVNK